MERFDHTKHLLTKDGNPWTVRGGSYRMLPKGKTNDPESIAKYFAKGSRPEVVSHDPKGVVYDKSVIGSNGQLQQQTAQIITSTDDIKKMQEEIDKAAIVGYNYYDRRLEKWVRSEYNLNELMNKLEEMVLLKGGKIDIKEEGPKCRNIHVTNSFGAYISLNVEQPPAIIEREVKRIMFAGKPHMGEDDAQYAAPGEFKYGIVAQ